MRHKMMVTLVNSDEDVKEHETVETQKIIHKGQEAAIK